MTAREGETTAQPKGRELGKTHATAPRRTRTRSALLCQEFDYNAPVMSWTTLPDASDVLISHASSIHENTTCIAVWWRFGELLVQLTVELSQTTWLA